MVLIKSFLLPTTTTSMSLANLKRCIITLIWFMMIEIVRKCGTQNHFNSANLSTYPVTQILSEHAQCRDFRSPPESFSRAKTFLSRISPLACCFQPAAQGNFTKNVASAETLHYWWVPDATFIERRPEPVIFPRHSPSEWVPWNNSEGFF